MRTVPVQFVNEEANAVLIDVRTPVEREEVHAPRAVLHPLSDLKPAEIAALAAGRPVYILCRTGKRAQQAAEKLEQAGVKDVAVVGGGMDAWAAAGLPVVRGRKTISLERQVRIAAGLLVLTGVVLGFGLHRGFFGISAFVGGGLVFAGITDWCGMGMLLARMPWNRRSCVPSCCSKQPV